MPGRIGFLERSHPRGHRGAIAPAVVALLRAAGATVDVVHAERGAHPLGVRPPWDVIVLKSGSSAALHVAAAAEAWGVPSVNAAEATRLAQDRLATAAILERAGLPVPRSRLAWLGPSGPAVDGAASVGSSPLVVKAARGSRGRGIWHVEAHALGDEAPALPDGPYLLMDRVEHRGDDLKVFVAGEWMAGVARRFPARTLAAKRGRPVAVPAEVADVARRVGDLLGLTCFGCDFVLGAASWALVDVNAFPGYKGAVGAPEALARHILRTLRATIEVEPCRAAS